MTDSSATVVAGPGAAVVVVAAAEEEEELSADRMYDGGYSDRDDNSSIAPFPPYRERDDYEDSFQEATAPESDNSGDDDNEETEPQTPTLPADGNAGADADADAEAEASATTHHADTRVRLFSDAAQHASAASAADGASHESHEQRPSQPPTKPPSPQPAPPPPYWKHSRDVNDDDAEDDGVRDVAQGPGQGQGQGQAHDRAHPIASSTERPASSSLPAVATKPSPAPTKPRPAGLSLFLRPTASNKSKSKSKSRQSTSPGASSSASSSSQSGHRRDTSSSSTLDFAANLITLQDNEAAENTAAAAAAAAYNNDATIMSPASLSSQTSSLASGSQSFSNAWLFGLDTPPATAPLMSPACASGRSGSVPVPTVGKSSRCWARRVDITDYTVINGSGGGLSLGGGAGHPRIGAFVVWTVRVETLGTVLPFSPVAAAVTTTTMTTSPTASTSAATPAPPPAASTPTPTGTVFCIYKRYSEFDTLRRHLVANFPQARRGGALPPLPPKSVLGKFRPSFLEQRRLGLQYFLNCILLNPEFSGSPVLQEFLFG